MKNRIICLVIILVAMNNITCRFKSQKKPNKNDEGWVMLSEPSSQSLNHSYADLEKNSKKGGLTIFSLKLNFEDKDLKGKNK